VDMSPRTVVRYLGKMTSLKLFESREEACLKNITRVLEVLQKKENYSSIHPLTVKSTLRCFYGVMQSGS